MTNRAMTFQEKVLYHQIHPLKLLVDWLATIPALYLLWQHKLLAGLAITFIPSIVATALVIRLVDLAPYQHSAAGRYLRRTMTTMMQGLRLAGLGVMCIGAWWHVVWMIPAGLAVILFAWFHGVLFRGESGRTSP